jgi:hypothetical protein
VLGRTGMAGCQGRLFHSSMPCSPAAPPAFPRGPPRRGTASSLAASQQVLIGPSLLLSCSGRRILYLAQAGRINVWGARIACCGAGRSGGNEAGSTAALFRCACFDARARRGPAGSSAGGSSPLEDGNRSPSSEEPSTSTASSSETNGVAKQMGLRHVRQEGGDWGSVRVVQCSTIAHRYGEVCNSREC